MLNYEELSFVLAASIRRTDYTDAWKVLDIFQCDFTTDELERMLATRIQLGSFDLALHAARMAGRPLTQVELDQVAIIGLRVHGNAHQAVQMAIRGLLSVSALKILTDIAAEKSLRQTATFLTSKIVELETMLVPLGSAEAAPASMSTA